MATVGALGLAGTTARVGDQRFVVRVARNRAQTRVRLRRQLVEEFGFDHSFELPIEPDLAKWCDEGRPAVLEELLYCLFHIAKADGRVDEAELAFLQGVATEFGLSDADFQRIRAEEWACCIFRGSMAIKAKAASCS